MNDELTIYRLQKESEDLERFETELLETAALLKLYRSHHDDEPASIHALKLWASATLEKPVDPHAVLTRTEIAQLWEDAEY